MSDAFWDYMRYGVFALMVLYGLYGFVREKKEAKEDNGKPGGK